MAEPQHVNLYYGDLLPPPERIPLLYLWAAILVGLVVAVLDIWWTSSELHDVRAKWAASQQQHAELKAQLAKLKAEVPDALFRAQMAQRIQNLQKLLAQSAGTIELIEAIQKRQRVKYSQLLNDLENIPEQVWLTAFRFDHRGLRLEGATQHDEEVAGMIRRLQSLASTSHVQYGVFRLVSDEKKPNIRRFVVAPIGEEVDALDR